MFKFLEIKQIFPLFIFIIIACSSSKNISTDKSFLNNSEEEQTISTENDEINEIKNDIIEDLDIQLPTNLLFRDHNYVPNIASVQCYRKGFDQSIPIIAFESSEQIILKFDDFNEDRKNYYVKLIHCDALWTPSPLETHEYLDGFDQDEIIKIDPSFNTYHNYTHYQYTFPNDQLKLSKSGNYLLIIFDDNDINKLVLTRKVYLRHTRAIIEGQVTKPASPKYIYTNQAIKFNVDLNGFDVNNIFDDVRVIISQNNRWDNMIADLKPTFANNSKLTYYHQDNNHFPGGKEYRTIDTRNLNFQSERIKSIITGNPTRIILKTDEFRSFINKMEWKDLNGKFSIATTEGENSDLESEYTKVAFFLKPAHKNEYDEGNIYLFGAMTNWDIDENYLFKYNYNSHLYELNLLLKQGVYNYHYAFINHNDKNVDIGFIEGNSKDTENDYTVFVYAKSLGENYDALIGYKIINSIKHE